MVLAPDAEAQWVPFELTPGNQIRFRMTVDGRAATAMLDTGFSLSVISRRWASAAGLRIANGGQGIGDRRVGRDGPGQRADAGDRRADQDRRAARRARSAGRRDRQRDHDRRGDRQRPAAPLCARHRFRRSAASACCRAGACPSPGKARRCRCRAATSSISARCASDGTRLRPMIVDTGDGATIAVSAEAWQALGAGRPATTTTVSYSVAGAVQSDLAVLPEIAVGDSTLRQAETLIEAGGGFSSRMGASGRIGIGFLQRFRVLLDPARGADGDGRDRRHRPAAAALDQRAAARRPRPTGCACSTSCAAARRRRAGGSRATRSAAIDGAAISARLSRAQSRSRCGRRGAPGPRRCRLRPVRAAAYRRADAQRRFY